MHLHYTIRLIKSQLFSSLLIHFIQANIDCPNSYVVQLIAFDYDKVGNLGNLSRINPALLGTKDVGKSIKNSIHLFGQSAEPLLCFSVVMVMGDNHEDGLEFGSETGWIVKSVPGVLPSLELEHLVSVLGLAFQLPYVPDDSSRRDMDILYVSMYKNAFNFSTVTTPAAGEGILPIQYCTNSYILWQMLKKLQPRQAVPRQ
jgi:hypothetical protein